MPGIFRIVQQLDQPACLGRQVQILGIQLLVIDEQFLVAQAQLLQGRGDGLFCVLEQMARLVADSAPVSDHWRATDRNGPALADAQKRLTRLVKPLLEQAIASGTCRPDLTAKDVILVSSMLGSGLRGRTRTERRSLSRRALQLLLEGLRAPALPKSPHP